MVESKKKKNQSTNSFNAKKQSKKLNRTARPEKLSGVTGTEINSKNKVVGTFVGKDEDELLDGEVVNWEEYYSSVNGGIKIKRFSYNTKGGIHHTQNADGVPVPSDDQSKAYRGNIANVGSFWDEANEIFYSAKDPDKNSWTLNTTTGLWEAPVTFPDDGNDYYWNEELYQSDNTQGWLIYHGD